MSRVTFTHINDVVLRNLNQNYNKLAKLQEQLSSGKRITRPSDAPIDTTNDLELRSDINHQKQLQRNIDDASAYLSVLDATLNSSNDVMHSLRERAIQGANDTNTSSERLYINKEVEQLVKQLITISNATYKGDHLFAGRNVDKPPFLAVKGAEKLDTVDNSAADPTDTVFALNTPIQLWDRDADGGARTAERMFPGSVVVPNLTEGTDYTVDYVNGRITFLTAAASAEAATQTAANGGMDITFEWVSENTADMTGKLYRQIDGLDPVQVNMTTDEVFGNKLTDTNVFDSLIGMMEGLHKNQQPMIEEAIGDIDIVFERILAAQATTGSRMNKIENSADRLSDKIVENTRIQSELEDLDFAQAISEFTLAESVYNASLQSAARVLQPSLSNFI